MKKYFVVILLILLSVFSFNPSYASAATSKAKAKVTIHKKVIPKKVIKTRKVALSKVTWTPAAQKVLRHVPSFARAKVKAKVDDYARKHNIKVITPAIYNNIHV